MTDSIKYPTEVNGGAGKDVIFDNPLETIDLLIACGPGILDKFVNYKGLKVEILCD